MAISTIYLDVDGVIAPFGSQPSSFAGWTYRKIRVSGMEIEYSPNVVAALKQFASVAEIVWLTSWEEAAPLELAPALGLPHFRTLIPFKDADRFGEGQDWWKLNCLRADARDGSFIWIDDELQIEPKARAWAVENSGHTISPASHIGLTPTHLERVANLLCMRVE